MQQLFMDISDAAARHLPLLGLFAQFVRPKMLAHFVGPQGIYGELYARLAGETIDEATWDGVLQEGAEIGIVFPLGPGVYQLNPSLGSMLRGRMFEQYSDEGLKSLTLAYLDLYSGFCAEVLDQWSRSAVIPTLVVEESNIIKGLGLAVKEEAWMDVLNIARCLAEYLKQEERQEEWRSLRARLLEATGHPLDQSAALERVEAWLFLLRDEANDDLDAGRPEIASEKQHAMLACLEGRTDQAAQLHRGMSLHQLGVIAHAQGDFKAAEQWLNQAMSLFEGAGPAAYQINTLCMLGILRIDQGRHLEAVPYLGRAYPLALEAGRKNITAILYQLGRCLEVLGEEQFLRVFPQRAESHAAPLHIIRQVLKEARHSETAR